MITLAFYDDTSGNRYCSDATDYECWKLRKRLTRLRHTRGGREANAVNNGDKTSHRKRRRLRLEYERQRIKELLSRVVGTIIQARKDETEL
jgi:hypothetical protein